jgi:hypothetical protein
MMRLRLHPFSWERTEAASTALVMFYGNGNLKSGPRVIKTDFGIRRGRRHFGFCAGVSLSTVVVLGLPFPPPPKPPLPTVGSRLSGWAERGGV